MRGDTPSTIIIAIVVGNATVRITGYRTQLLEVDLLIMLVIGRRS